MKTNNQLNIISMIFSSISILIAFYFVFFVKSEAQINQGLYWFIVSIVSAIIPHIKNLKYKDLELSLKEEIEKVEKKIDDKLAKFNKELSDAWTYWKDVTDPPEIRDFKDKTFKNYNEKFLQKIDANERYSYVKKFNEFYFNKFDATIEKIKHVFYGLGYYSGNLDNEYNLELVNSIISFQNSLGLEPDGIFGADTYKALSEIIAKK